MTAWRRALLGMLACCTLAVIIAAWQAQHPAPSASAAINDDTPTPIEDAPRPFAGHRRPNTDNLPPPSSAPLELKFSAAPAPPPDPLDVTGERPAIRPLIQVKGKPTPRGEKVIFHTVAGDLLFALYPDIAPNTVSNFLKHVRLGTFDTTHFGRAEPGFVLQVYNADDRLNPLTDAMKAALVPMPAEFNTLKHRRGILSFARDDHDIDSAISSFSVLLGDAPHLDTHYTIFGHVEKGLEVLDRMIEVPRVKGKSPAARLTIWHAEVVADSSTSIDIEGPRSIKDIFEQAPPRSLARRATALLHDRCVRCHGGEKTRGGLDLRSRAGLLRGGEHGPAVLVGNSENSLLWKRLHAEGAERMPPEGEGEGEALAEVDQAILALWIDARLPGSGLDEVIVTTPAPITGTVTADDAKHWSFAPFLSQSPPDADDPTWCRNDLDRFILRRLKDAGLKPNAEADRRVLYRRLSFDLLGLPPDPAEIQAFLSDSAPNAYERAVDRMLASPHFGEHWARHWLDVTRYADSNGYENDENRPFAYSYRDAVIRVFNDDVAFDRFVRWQIAGDELEPTNPLAVAATGFATAGPVQTFMPRKQDRYEELDDIVSTTGSALLGLTVGCARCHDHKYDPIPQRDYYGLLAAFMGTRREIRYLVPDGGTDYLRQRHPVDEVRRRLDTIRQSCRDIVRNEKIGNLSISEADKALLRQPVNNNNEQQASLLRLYGDDIEPSEAQILAVRTDEQHERWSLLEAEIEKLSSSLPPEPPQGLTLAGSGVTRSFFLERGRWEREREVVPPSFLTALTRGQPRWEEKTWTAWDPPAGVLPSLPRSALARWLTDVEGGAGRLVARAIVNRLWQQHFGTGLSRTPNDLGRQGDKPSHPELLDWLAQQLIAHGWRLKPLHRLIVTSATYRQDGAADADKLRVDPENRLLGRRRSQRLTAEQMRDAILTSAGTLNRTLYGPGIKPPIPAETIFPTAPKHGEVWPTDAIDGPAVWRRSLYIVTKRSNYVPLLQTFDAPDASTSCATRSRTVVPTQALLLLNDPFIQNQASRLAERVRLTAGASSAKQIQAAFQFTLARPPKPAESERALAFLSDRPTGLVDLCQVLIQTNEFLYVD